MTRGWADWVLFDIIIKGTPTTEVTTPEAAGAAQTISCDIHVDIKIPDSLDSLTFTNVIRNQKGPNTTTPRSGTD